MSHEAPQLFGYSQSMSIPSNTSAQRGSSTRLRQDCANACGFAAAWVKPFDQVQPPNDHSTFRPGCMALSLRSWLKLPRAGILVVAYGLAVLAYRRRIA